MLRSKQAQTKTREPWAILERQTSKHKYEILLCFMKFNIVTSERFDSLPVFEMGHLANLNFVQNIRDKNLHEISTKPTVIGSFDIFISDVLNSSLRLAHTPHEITLCKSACVIENTSLRKPLDFKCPEVHSPPFTVIYMGFCEPCMEHQPLNLV